MKTPEKLFRGSIEQYQNLIRKTSDIHNNMANLSPDEIFERCQQVLELQQDQAKVDKFIVDVMIDIGPQILDTPYVGEYQRIIAKAKQASDKVASKARILQALLHEEIEKMKHGQKGLAGYTAAAKESVNSLDGHY